MTSFVQSIAGALIIAGVSTLGDFVWATWLPQHRAIYGLTHGLLLFLSIGLFLGVVSGRAASGTLAGGLIGLLAAGSFYALAPLIGFSAMFVAWIAAWLALGVLSARLYDPHFKIGEVLAKGSAAALLSGIAFYFVSGIWRPFNPRGWDYAVHFGSWTLVYLAGFLPLLARVVQPAREPMR